MNGDLAGKSARVQRELAQLKYPGTVDEVGLRLGDPVALLPLLHFVLLKFSRHVAACIHKAGYELQGKTDQKFVEISFRLFRECLNVKTVLTAAQFLEQGFAERKLLLLCDVITACKRIHNEEIRKERLAALKNRGAVGVADGRAGHEPSRSTPEIKVVKGGVEVRQVVTPQHLPNSSDGGQSVYKVKQRIVSPLLGTGAASGRPSSAAAGGSRGSPSGSAGGRSTGRRGTRGSPTLGTLATPHLTPNGSPALGQQHQQALLASYTATAAWGADLDNHSINPATGPSTPLELTFAPHQGAQQGHTPGLMAGGLAGLSTPIHSWFVNPAFATEGQAEGVDNAGLGGADASAALTVGAAGKGGWGDAQHNPDHYIGQQQGQLGGASSAWWVSAPQVSPQPASKAGRLVWANSSAGHDTAQGVGNLSSSFAFNAIQKEGSGAVGSNASTQAWGNGEGSSQVTTHRHRADPHDRGPITSKGAAAWLAGAGAATASAQVALRAVRTAGSTTVTITKSTGAARTGGKSASPPGHGSQQQKPIYDKSKGPAGGGVDEDDDEDSDDSDAELLARYLGRPLPSARKAAEQQRQHQPVQEQQHHWDAGSSDGEDGEENVEGEEHEEEQQQEEQEDGDQDFTHVPQQHSPEVTGAASLPLQQPTSQQPFSFRSAPSRQETSVQPRQALVPSAAGGQAGWGHDHVPWAPPAGRAGVWTHSSHSHQQHQQHEVANSGNASQHHAQDAYNGSQPQPQHQPSPHVQQQHYQQHHQELTGHTAEYSSPGAESQAVVKAAVQEVQRELGARIESLREELAEAAKRAAEARAEHARTSEALAARVTVLEGRVRFLECEVEACVRRGEYGSLTGGGLGSSGVPTTTMPAAPTGAGAAAAGAPGSGSRSGVAGSILTGQPASLGAGSPGMVGVGSAGSPPIGSGFSSGSGGGFGALRTSLGGAGAGGVRDSGLSGAVHPLGTHSSWAAAATPAPAAASHSYHPHYHHTTASQLPAGVQPPTTAELSASQAWARGLPAAAGQPLAGLAPLSPSHSLSHLPHHYAAATPAMTSQRHYHQPMTVTAPTPSFQAASVLPAQQQYQSAYLSQYHHPQVQPAVTHRHTVHDMPHLQPQQQPEGAHREQHASGGHVSLFPGYAGATGALTAGAADGSTSSYPVSTHQPDLQHTSSTITTVPQGGEVAGVVLRPGSSSSAGAGTLQGAGAQAATAATEHSSSAGSETADAHAQQLRSSSHLTFTTRPNSSSSAATAPATATNTYGAVASWGGAGYSASGAVVSATGTTTAGMSSTAAGAHEGVASAGATAATSATASTTSQLISSLASRYSEAQSLLADLRRSKGGSVLQ